MVESLVISFLHGRGAAGKHWIADATLSATVIDEVNIALNLSSLVIFPATSLYRVSII